MSAVHTLFASHYSHDTKGTLRMKLTPPSFPSWLFAVLFGAAGIAGKYGFFAAAAPHAFLLVMIAFLILLAATLFAGL